MKSGYYVGRAVGIAAVDLISPDYRAQQMALHAAPRGYGGKGDKWADGVIQVADHYDCHSILDYGCGQGSLKRAIQEKTDRFAIREYDPAIPGKDALPMFADLVSCTDVIEHIEPELLDTVLRHIRSLSRKAAFVVIATRPSNKVLPDGRNAHLTVESDDWWRERLIAAGFDLHEGPKSPLTKVSREFVAVLTERAA